MLEIIGLWIIWILLTTRKPDYPGIYETTTPEQRRERAKRILEELQGILPPERKD